MPTNKTVLVVLVLVCLTLFGSIPHTGRLIKSGLTLKVVGSFVTIPGNYCDGTHIIAANPFGAHFNYLPIADTPYDCRFITISNNIFSVFKSGSDLIYDVDGTTGGKIQLLSGVKSGAYYRVITSGDNNWYLTHRYNDNVEIAP